jgi:4-hydroxy-tetrahydrodipicolinate synthase
MSLNNYSNIHGVISALITPFLDQEVDYASLEKCVEFQLSHGVNGFVVNGTTAESPTLKPSEVKKIFSVVKAIAGLNVPVILGTGSNSTEKTIENTKLASDLGADAALVVVPYYNKPPQRGLSMHFKAVAKNSDIPIILYNVPGRTITSLSEDTILELADTKKIIGIKEASGDLAFDQKLKSSLPPDFIFLSGDDETYLDFLKLGGQGIISVMSNVIPQKTAQWLKMIQQGDITAAEIDFQNYKQFISGLYVEANPIAPKWVLYKMGIIKSAELRLPLVELDFQHRRAVEKLMNEVGLI